MPQLLNDFFELRPRVQSADAYACVSNTSPVIACDWPIWRDVNTYTPEYNRVQCCRERSAIVQQLYVAWTVIKLNLLNRKLLKNPSLEKVVTLFDN